MIKNLIIFDFSGTLSLGAVSFAREENLIQAFKLSGLWRLGLTSSSYFWNEVVAPSWESGSTTSIGYVQALHDTLNRLFPSVSPEELRACVSSFAEEYFKSSALETEWLPLLRRLVENPENTVLIATDHYAEASRHILEQCETFGLPAEVLDSDGMRRKTDRIYVANSADLGAVKTDVRFWRKLQERLSCAAPAQLFIIDDFGWNEANGDSYGREEKVHRRRAVTEARLSETFDCPVNACVFRLHSPAGCREEDAREEFRVCVIRTENYISTILNIPG